MRESAMVLLSGGLDSTVCLFWAKRNFHTVRAITWDYMQRHFQELTAAKIIAGMADVQHEIRRFEAINTLCESALTRNKSIISIKTIVTPLRNFFMLGGTAVVAHNHGINTLVFGANQSDWQDFPDCRHPFIKGVETTIRVGLDKCDFHIETPLLELDKASIIQMAKSLPECWNTIAHTVTCYEMHTPNGGCGTCPACQTRQSGFTAAGILDPAIPRC